MMKKNYKYVKLSSKWTTIGYYGSIVIYLLVSPILLFIAWDNYNINSLVGVAIWLAFSVFIYLIVRYTAISYIEDNIIYAKKFFRPQEQFKLNQLEKLKTYDSRRDKYITLTMEKEGTKEKFLIMHSKVFYSGESIDAENILNDIISEHKNQL